MDAHVEIRGLRKRFGAQEVLRGVDLAIERGRINFVIGGSGTGKSVLLKHIVGLLRPDRGEILIDGQEITSLSERALTAVRRQVGLLFQHSALFDSMTVEDNVAFPLLEHRRDLSRAEVRATVRAALARLGLGPETAAQNPSELSGGQRRRVALARALVLRPEVLLYDEPTTGLDPVATRNVDEMITQAAREHGVTSVVVSHDMASTFRIGHRVAMLHEGVVWAEGTPAEILASRDPVVREFLESSTVRTVETPAVPS